MGGVRFARNRVHHQWSDALVLNEGERGYPKTFPVVYFEWRWRSAGDLPKPDKPDPEGEAVYQQQLQGEQARDTTRQLANVFNVLRKRLEPRGLAPVATPPIVTSS
jgi:hypothetical protein